MPTKTLTTLLSAALLAGCAQFSSDGGFTPVADTARERLGKDAAWLRTDDDRSAARTRTRELLAAPLDADAAIQVALLNSPALQASFANLGIAEADYVQATRLPNPGFSFSRKSGDDVLKIDRAVTIGVMNLLALPFAARIEDSRFAQARLQAADAVLRHAEATRRAWVEAVAAEQAMRYAEQVRRTAETGALFARDMARAGNMSALDHAREQAFYADAAAQLARARERTVSARERLTRQLGLWGDDARQYRLPERLPDLPGTRPEMQDLESYAIAQRLDLQAGRAQLESLARSLGLTRATRFVSVIDVGYLHNSDNGRRETGYGIDIEVPLFDWGTARVARAEAVYTQAAAQLADRAIAARSSVRERYASYQARYDVARHYRDEVVPLRKRIGNEHLLRYNGMLLSVFELLADARDQIAAVNGYLDAQRDYWLADAELRGALGGTFGGRLPDGPTSNEQR